MTARPRAVAGDPLEAVNVKAFEATQAVDRAAVGPIALGYRHIVPEPARDGLRNALRNLREPVVAINFLLQLKPGKAAETLARLGINSTIGVAGLVDVARRKPFHLPYRPNGFADTFGYYGVKPGAYLFLPLVGPTTVRDLVGGGLDRLVLPLAIGRPFNRVTYTIPTGVIGALQHRINIDDELRELREKAPDPYAALRDAYLRRRQAEIDALHGHIPARSIETGGAAEKDDARP
ncbi:MAG: VacJ family lipoprotein [Novosphingobium sp.]|nr:VacJ family lipoprotein [Novosphingobium sp.]